VASERGGGQARLGFQTGDNTSAIRRAFIMATYRPGTHGLRAIYRSPSVFASSAIAPVSFRHVHYLLYRSTRDTFTWFGITERNVLSIRRTGSLLETVHAFDGVDLICRRFWKTFGSIKRVESTMTVIDFDAGGRIRGAFNFKRSSTIISISTRPCDFRQPCYYRVRVNIITYGVCLNHI